MDSLDLKAQAEWIEASLAGDHAALSTLMGRHQDAVFRMAFLLSGDPHEAEDIAQETFVHAFRSLHRFDPGRPLQPWLLQITKNTAYNSLRAARRYLAALERAARRNPWLLANADSPSRASAARDESNQLWRAVRELASRDQDVIYLRYFMELSEAESASGLNVPPGTIKSRTHRALKRLRHVVETRYPELIEGA